MTHHTYLRSLVLVSFVAFGFAATTAADEDDKSKLMTRSIYVPVEFELCEHLSDALLYEGEQAISVMPARRIFQFTYYPHLGRIEPEKTEVRVEGTRSDGEHFTGRLAVTPWGIFTAHEQIETDFKKQLARMKHRLDVRYKSRTLVLQCSDACRLESKPESVAADAAVSASP